MIVVNKMFTTIRCTTNKQKVAYFYRESHSFKLAVEKYKEENPGRPTPDIKSVLLALYDLPFYRKLSDSNFLAIRNVHIAILFDEAEGTNEEIIRTLSEVFSLNITLVKEILIKQGRLQSPVCLHSFIMHKVSFSKQNIVVNKFCAIIRN